MNDAVVAAAADPAVTLEADRFNLECHTVPIELGGRPFAELHQQLERTLALARDAAALQHYEAADARVAAELGALEQDTLGVNLSVPLPPRCAAPPAEQRATA